MSHNLLKAFLILTFALLGQGICGNSITSLGPYQLGSTISQVKDVGYTVKLTQPENYFKNSIYEVVINEAHITLFFSEGLLKSIIMKIEESSYQEYLEGQQDFLQTFRKRPDVNDKPGVIPQYVTIWWHDVGTIFSLNYDPKSYTIYMSLMIR